MSHSIYGDSNVQRTEILDSIGYQIIIKSTYNMLH